MDLAVELAIAVNRPVTILRIDNNHGGDGNAVQWYFFFCELGAATNPGEIGYRAGQ